MNHQVLRQILVETTGELFAAYGVSTDVVGAAAMDNQTLCGVLGFTGDAICGSVVIAASPEAVAASNPIEGAPATQWLSELTNQIVGRFKNSLVRRGVDIWISIPVVLNATRLVPVVQPAVEPIYMHVGGARFTIWLEVEGDVTLNPPIDNGMLSEGEALLF